MKLGTENHWVVVIIITDAQQHKMYFCVLVSQLFEILENRIRDR
jgi:hypothetical protein